MVVWSEKKEEKEEKTPGKCDGDCGNCKIGDVLKGTTAGDEMLGKILPLILLSGLTRGMENLSAEDGD